MWTNEERDQLLKLPFPMRRKFTATMVDIDRLPVTRYEPHVPDWQLIDWDEPLRDLDPIDADAIARDINTIRDLPEVA